MITAILLTVAMLGLGMGSFAYVDGQQRQSGDERVRESAFNVGEAALDAQVFQLSHQQWPSTPGAALPASCTPSSSATPICPNAASLSAAYTGADYSTAACPGGGAAGPSWTTYVHDDSAGAEQNYNAKTSTGANQPTWDSNGNGKLWLKATGTARCKQRTMVTAVQRGTKTLSFPRNAVAANWVSTSNNGNKVIIDTQGGSDQSADVVARCTGSAPTPCLNYRTGQISPSVPKTDAGAPAIASPIGDMDAFKALAQRENTYFPSGCPGSLTGAHVYVEDFTGCNAGDANSSASPGVMYIARGTLSLGGNTKIYGLVYMGNKQLSSGAVVTLSGNARIVGAVAIDGGGGLIVGSSYTNLTFDGRVFEKFTGLGGLGVAPNTFRELAGS